MAWTLEHVESSTEQSVSEWGLTGLAITRVSQGVDQLRFTESAAAYDDPPTFAFDDTIRLKRDGTTVFVGRIQQPKSINRVAESREYQVSGPWSWLEQIVYQQEWRTTNGVDTSVIESRRSRIILGQTKTGAKIATGVEMIAAIQWAIDVGAEIAIGTIDASVTIPYQELVDVTVAELIRTCLRWTPDAQTWIDYTQPTPTIHIRRRSALASVSLALSPANSNGLEITSREDLQVPCVCLRYEKSHTVDGEVYSTVDTDLFPVEASGSEPRAFVATIDLAGSAASYEIQTLETAAILPSSKSFWKDQLPALKGYLDTDLTISDASATDPDGAPTSLDRYVISGAITDWMGVGDGEVIATAKITYAGSDFPAFENGVASVRLPATDTSRTVFDRLVSFDAAEPTPVGLAQAMYEALSPLQWQGRYELAEEDVSGVVHTGNKLRLTGGLAAWATMDAAIQQVIENLDTGKTTIIFGPPQHLGPQDLVALLRANRQSRASWRRKERETGRKTASGGYSQGPKRTANANAAFAPTGGGGGAPRVLPFNLTGATVAVPSVASMQSDIETLYAGAGLVPKVGDHLVSAQFVFFVGPSESYPGSPSFSSFPFTVSGQTFQAIQIGPNRFLF